MKMPLDTALWLQFNLYLITLEGYSPSLFIDGGPGGNNGKMYRWQLAVDTLYRCLTCEIMYIWNDAWLNSVGVKNKLGFINALALHNPFDEDDFSENGAAYWLDPLLYGTDCCRLLINKYNIGKFEGKTVCKPFIDEIELVFERHGVGWSETPLIFVKQRTNGVGLAFNSESD